MSPSLSNHNSQYVSNENDPLSFVNQDDSMSEQDNHTPLRLNGGGDTSFENQERFNPGHQGNVMKTSLSEQDIRDVLFEAGYTIKEIDNVLAANIVAGLNDLSNTTICAKSDVSGNCYNSMLPAGINDLSNSTVSVESDISSTGFIRGSDLTDLGDISLSDSGTENAFDTLKEIRVKNVNKVVIGTLNINSLAPKFDELRGDRPFETQFFL